MWIYCSKYSLKLCIQILIHAPSLSMTLPTEFLMQIICSISDSFSKTNLCSHFVWSFNWLFVYNFFLPIFLNCINSFPIHFESCQNVLSPKSLPPSLVILEVLNHYWLRHLKNVCIQILIYILEWVDLTIWVFRPHCFYSDNALMNLHNCFGLP